MTSSFLLFLLTARPRGWKWEFAFGLQALPRSATWPSTFGLISFLPPCFLTRRRWRR